VILIGPPPRPESVTYVTESPPPPSSITVYVRQRTYLTFCMCVCWSFSQPSTAKLLANLKFTVSEILFQLLDVDCTVVHVQSVCDQILDVVWPGVGSGPSVAAAPRSPGSPVACRSGLAGLGQAGLGLGSQG
jgi:hypothetical protein